VRIAASRVAVAASSARERLGAVQRLDVAIQVAVLDLRGSEFGVVGAGSAVLTGNLTDTGVQLFHPGNGLIPRVCGDGHGFVFLGMCGPYLVFGVSSGPPSPQARKR
jgi:hypothetical protein